jgi:predicted nucleotidyltransferase
MKMPTIEFIRSITVPIAKRYGVKKVALFGSVANGTAREDSDVDIVISKGRLKGLWQYAGLVMDLEEALGAHVDVLEYDQLAGAFLGEPIGEEIVLYEE